MKLLAATLTAAALTMTAQLASAAGDSGEIVIKCPRYQY